PTVVWTAPTSTGSVPLRVAASDPSGATATLDIVVQVGTGMGAAFVNVDLNGSPELVSILPEPTQIDIDDTTYLDATVVDPDGDGLLYDWEVVWPCEGFFDDPTLEDPSFTLVDVPPGDDCEIRVTATDGRGGQNTGTIAVATGPGPCDPEPCGDLVPAPGEMVWFTNRYVGGEVADTHLALDPSGYVFLASTVDESGSGDANVAYLGAFVLGGGFVDSTDPSWPSGPLSWYHAVGATSTFGAYAAGEQEGGLALVERYTEYSLTPDWTVTFASQGAYGLAVDPSDEGWVLAVQTDSVRIDRYGTTGLISTPHTEPMAGVLPGGSLTRELSGHFVACGTVQRATRDIWLMELDATGAKLWSHTWDSGVDETCEAVAVSGLGEIYVTGARGPSATSDAWVGRFDTVGGYLGSTVVDLGGADSGAGIAVAPTGQVYVSANGSSGPPRLTAYFPTLAQRWTTSLLGGNAGDVRIDDQGYVVVPGAGISRVQIGRFAP
ncbi:MAG: hypothetical protein KC656_21800, partial [Myxococcales bacterium]|nr:hypothetical protein [Myxococcales bacterium]